MKKIYFYITNAMLVFLLTLSIFILNLDLNYTKYKTLLADDTKKLYQAKRDSETIDLLFTFKNNKQVNKDNLIHDLKLNQTIQNDIITRIKDNDDLITYESFYIVNTLRIKAKKRLLTTLLDNPNIEKIESNNQLEQNIGFKTNQVQQNNNQASDPMWNIEMINATKLWDQNIYGEGIILGVIDTAVDITHPGLKRKFVGYDSTTQNINYKDGFLDALEGVNESPNSSMDREHGTHVTGTILGSELDSSNKEFNKVGVAPKARFINARALDTNKPDLAVNSVFIRAGQWMLSPNGKPENRPRVINNSWGGGQNDNWYQAMLQNWISANITPVFAAGNRRQEDNPNQRPKVVYPGALDEALTVGAVDINQNLASFSCAVHPSDPKKMKPEITAPGVNIKSTMPDNNYGFLNGTSMAAPHVTGMVALLLSKKNDLSVDNIKNILMSSAKPRSDAEFPNTPNSGYGYGIIDGEYAYLLAQGKKIHTLTIKHDFGVNAYLDIYKDGTLIKSLIDFRDIKLEEGSYEIKINRLGFKEYSQTIILDQSKTITPKLEPEEQFSIKGTIRGNNELISNAKLTFKSKYGYVETSSSNRGSYELSLPKGEYELTIYKENFETLTSNISVNNEINQDYELNLYNKQVSINKHYTGSLNANEYDDSGLLHIGNTKHYSHFGYEAGITKFRLTTKTKIYSINAFFRGSYFKEFNDTKAKLSIFSYDNKKREVYHLKDHIIDIVHNKMNLINLLKFNLNLEGDIYFKFSSLNPERSGFVMGVDDSNLLSDTSYVAEGSQLYKLDRVKTTNGPLNGHLMMELVVEKTNANETIDSPSIDEPIRFNNLVLKGKSKTNGYLVATLNNGLSFISKIKDNKFEIELAGKFSVADVITMYLIDEDGNRSKPVYLRVLNDLSKLDEMLERADFIIQSSSNVAELANKFNEIKKNYKSLQLNELYPSYDEVIAKQEQIDKLAAELKELIIKNDPARTKLYEKIKEAQELLDNTKVSTDGRDIYSNEEYVIPNVHNFLKNNIIGAKNVLNNLDNGEFQLNERILFLEREIEYFKEQIRKGLKVNEELAQISRIKYMLNVFKEALVQNNDLYRTNLYYSESDVLAMASLISNYEKKELGKLNINQLKELYSEITTKYFDFRKKGIITTDLVLLGLNKPFKHYDDFLSIISLYQLDDPNIDKIKQVINEYYLKLLLNSSYKLIQELQYALISI